MEVRVIYFYANLLLWVFYIQYLHAIEREDPALHCAPSTKSQMQEFCSGKSFKMGIKSGFLDTFPTECILSVENPLFEHLEKSPLLLQRQDGKGKFSYRKGQCNTCNCCPSCWTCAELESYQCAEKNNLSQITLTQKINHSLIMTIGDEVEWDIQKKIESGDLIAQYNGDHRYKPAKDGWLQCAAIQRLPQGLEWNDEGYLKGTVLNLPGPYQEFQGNDPIHIKFTAVNTKKWKTHQSFERLEIKITLILHSRNESEVKDSIHANKFQKLNLDYAYNAWQRWDLNAMDKHLDLVSSSLQKYPFTGDCENQDTCEAGVNFAWRGSLGMNAHKYMRNILPEIEFYLGQALLFPSARVQEIAQMNLPGCFAKRQLESARWLLLVSAEILSAGIKYDNRQKWKRSDVNLNLAGYGSLEFNPATYISDAKKLLVKAEKSKEGWGWAVNDGEIWILLGIVDILEAIELGGQCTSNYAQDCRGLTVFQKLRDNSDINFGKALNRSENGPWKKYVTKLNGQIDDLLKNKPVEEQATNAYDAVKQTILTFVDKIRVKFKFPPRDQNLYMKTIKRMPWLQNAKITKKREILKRICDD